VKSEIQAQKSKEIEKRNNEIKDKEGTNGICYAIPY
jgi:hypothetical protein